MHVKPAGKAVIIFAVVGLIGAVAWKSGALDKVPTPVPVTATTAEPVASPPPLDVPLVAVAPVDAPKAPEAQASKTNVTSGSAGMAALLNAGKK